MNTVHIKTVPEMNMQMNNEPQDESMSDDEQVKFKLINFYRECVLIFHPSFQMVIAEEEPSIVKETHDIDLKCAEKVTDSDNEENMESNECKTKIEPATSISSDGQQQDGNSRDFTCKPKPIKAQRQNIDSPLSNYQQVPMYLSAYSPKNPTGILPFQPTGKENVFFCIDCVQFHSYA